MGKFLWLPRYFNGEKPDGKQLKREGSEETEECEKMESCEQRQFPWEAEQCERGGRLGKRQKEEIQRTETGRERSKASGNGIFETVETYVCY